LGACGNSDPGDKAPLDAGFAGTWTGTTLISGGRYASTSGQLVTTVSGNSVEIANLCPSGSATVSASGSGNVASWSGYLVCPSTAFDAWNCSSEVFTYTSVTATLDGAALIVVAKGAMGGCGEAGSLTMSFSATRGADYAPDFTGSYLGTFQLDSAGGQSAPHFRPEVPVSISVYLTVDRTATGLNHLLFLDALSVWTCDGVYRVILTSANTFTAVGSGSCERGGGPECDTLSLDFNNGHGAKQGNQLSATYNWTATCENTGVSYPIVLTYYLTRQ